MNTLDGLNKEQIKNINNIYFFIEDVIHSDLFFN